MAKKCIFCGKQMSEKSKEHVIPQWLIEMTGDKKRTAAFGVDYAKIFDDKTEPEKIKSREYPFLLFTFPACKKCNEVYGSGLEANTKNVLAKVLDGQSIGIEETNTLLDWFDKVRIGLWLGYLYYNEQLDSLDPKFYINDRLGQKDRLLLIYKCKENAKGINIIGPGGMLFSMIPSCFLLRINNYVFLNISKDALLLKDLGYPYLTIESVDGAGNMCGIIAAGFGTINQDLLSGYKIKATSKAIYQSIFKQFEDICQSEDLYVINNSLKQSEGLGAIFIRDGDIRKMGQNEEYSLEPNEIYENVHGLLQMLGNRTSRVLIDFANEEQNRIDRSELPDDRKKKMLMEIHTAITIEKLRMKHMKFELSDNSEE